MYKSLSFCNFFGYKKVEYSFNKVNIIKSISTGKNIDSYSVSPSMIAAFIATFDQEFWKQALQSEHVRKNLYKPINPQEIFNVASFDYHNKWINEAIKIAFRRIFPDKSTKRGDGNWGTCSLPGIVTLTTDFNCSYSIAIYREDIQSDESYQLSPWQYINNMADMGKIMRNYPSEMWIHADDPVLHMKSPWCLIPSIAGDVHIQREILKNLITHHAAQRFDKNRIFVINPPLDSDYQSFDFSEINRVVKNNQDNIQFFIPDVYNEYVGDKIPDSWVVKLQVTDKESF